MHLISLGTLGGGQCGAQGDDYQTVMSVPGLDLCEYHDYTPGQPIPGERVQRPPEAHRPVQRALGKPLLVGEMGVKPNDVGGTLARRADVVAGKLCAQLSVGVAGELLWAWSKDGSKLDDYDIGPGDPVLGVPHAMVRPRPHVRATGSSWSGRWRPVVTASPRWRGRHRRQTVGAQSPATR